MPICVNVCARALCVGALAAVSLVGALETARADDCLTEPNRAAGPGARWLYHVDRATNRKCWYLVGTGARAPVAEPPGPSPYDPPAPTLGSLFSGLGFGSPAQPDSSSSDARAPRPDDQRTDARPRPARQPQPRTEAALTAKPHRPSPAPPPVARADTEPQSRLSPTERDALFRAFLQWQEQQKPR